MDARHAKLRKTSPAKCYTMFTMFKQEHNQWRRRCKFFICSLFRIGSMSPSLLQWLKVIKILPSTNELPLLWPVSEASFPRFPFTTVSTASGRYSERVLLTLSAWTPCLAHQYSSKHRWHTVVANRHSFMPQLFLVWKLADVSIAQHEHSNVQHALQMASELIVFVMVLLAAHIFKNY